MIYELTRDAAELSDQLGDEVQVTGMVVAKSGANGTQEAGGTGGTLKRLHVNSVKHTSDTCRLAKSHGER
jgi:hypothetical protein